MWGCCVDSVLTVIFVSRKFDSQLNLGGILFIEIFARVGFWSSQFGRDQIDTKSQVFYLSYYVHFAFLACSDTCSPHSYDFLRS